MSYIVKIDILMKERITKKWWIMWLLIFIMYTTFAYFAAAKYLFDNTFNDIFEFFAFVLALPVLIVMYLYSFMVTILGLADLKGKLDKNKE